jgi:hypothetical protein
MVVFIWVNHTITRTASQREQGLSVETVIRVTGLSPEELDK